MTWSDCYTLAQQFYSMKYYNKTKLWLKHSMELLRQEPFAGESRFLQYMEDVAQNLIDLGMF